MNLKDKLLMASIRSKIGREKEDREKEQLKQRYIDMRLYEAMGKFQTLIDLVNSRLEQASNNGEFSYEIGIEEGSFDRDEINYIYYIPEKIRDHYEGQGILTKFSKTSSFIKVADEDSGSWINFIHFSFYWGEP